MHRISTYSLTIVAYICYSTRYTLGRMENGSSSTCTHQPADRKYKEIKTSRRHQVTMDDSYIDYLLAEDMDIGKDGTNWTGEVAHTLSNQDHASTSIRRDAITNATGTGEMIHILSAHIKYGCSFLRIELSLKDI